MKYIILQRKRKQTNFTTLNEKSKIHKYPCSMIHSYKMRKHRKPSSVFRDVHINDAHEWQNQKEERSDYQLLAKMEA